MSKQTDRVTYAVIEIMLGYAEAQMRAGELLKQAHDEGRQVSLDELKAIRHERTRLLAELDAAIAEAEAKGNG